jgi:hypothetical protein
MQITRLVRCLVLALVVLAISASSFAGVFVSVNIAPPVLPVYTQPACPGDGYIWTPGYWAYGPDGYYWVPGTWVVAPQPGFLWTPGYWAFSSGAYLWHAGYWGPHIGFYGGVNYGFGYFGEGYQGGYWHGRTFYYNRSVNNIRITNVHIYNRTVVVHERTRVAFNGGPGGINRRPSRDDERFMHERHIEATHMQVEHQNGARGNREFLASVNHGRPAIAATSRPGEFSGHNGVETRPIADHRIDNRADRRIDNRVDRRIDNRADRRMDNRTDNRAMNREVARPQNNTREINRPDNRNFERPVPHENAGNNRGGQPRNNMRPDNHGPAPRAENHGPAARPTAFHQESNRPRESAPRPQGEPKGHKGH